MIVCIHVRIIQSGGRRRNIFIGIDKGLHYTTSYDNIDKESTMNKSQLFALLTMTVLGLVIVSIIVYDSDASIEMQQCGGCHNPECTQEMAGTGTWDRIFNAIVPDQRGERALPCAAGHLRGCTECHAQTHGSKMIHAGMTASECSRCHVTPTAPMYVQCVFCHGNYQHADPGVTGDCMSCHPAHAADTSVGCGDCHVGEYADFTKSGGKHATKDTSYGALRHKLSPTTYSYESPLVGDGCYSCHEDHAESRIRELYELPQNGTWLRTG
jgi:hypothetical protein